MFQVSLAMGRLVEDPELRHTESGIAVTTFRLAVDRPYKVDGKEKADFFNVVVWRERAEFVCKYFKKGKPIFIQGRFENRDYRNKEGEKRWITELIAEKVGFAGDSSGRDKPPIGDPPPEKKTKADNDKPKPAADAGCHAGSDTEDFEEMPSDEDLPF